MGVRRPCNKGRGLINCLDIYVKPYVFLLLMLGTFVSAYAQPVVTVRFANPQFDCTTMEYCLDVEFQSDTPNEELFGMNVRFYYEDNELEFLDFRDFQGGYGAFSPNPPIVNTGNLSSGPSLFGLTGASEFVNGGMQLVNTGVPVVRQPHFTQFSGESQARCCQHNFALRSVLSKRGIHELAPLLLAKYRSHQQEEYNNWPQ